jgi:hypothetical protein
LLDEGQKVVEDYSEWGSEFIPRVSPEGFTPYCALNGEGDVLVEGACPTTKKGMAQLFGAMVHCRIAIEVGTHSPWVSDSTSSTSGFSKSRRSAGSSLQLLDIHLVGVAGCQPFARGVNLPPVQVKMPDGTVEQRKAVDLPSRFDLQLQSWDMAFKDTGKSDFVVGQVQVACGFGSMSGASPATGW